MKRALATHLPQECGDCHQDLDDREPYFVSGLVYPSADGSEWVVELVDVVLKGKHLKLSALTEAQQERAKDRLADMAQRAEQGALHG